MGTYEYVHFTWNIKRILVRVNAVTEWIKNPPFLRTERGLGIKTWGLLWEGVSHGPDSEVGSERGRECTGTLIKISSVAGVTIVKAGAKGGFWTAVFHASFPPLIDNPTVAELLEQHSYRLLKEDRYEGSSYTVIPRGL